MNRLKVDSFPEQKEMTKDDYVIICGDFGIWDDSKREKYNLDWLEDRPFTTLFVSGNHENYDILDNLPIEEWHGGKVNFIRPSVIHLTRGQVFNIEDKAFFAFGGASSHDISAGILEPDDPLFKEKKRLLDKDPFALYRINHVSWWQRELPNEEEMDNGYENLKRENNKVDYIITHSPPASVIALLGQGLYEQDSVDIDFGHRLAVSGSDHRKFLRQVFVTVDITAPLYWWKEFDTYKVGTVANSCSTMHKIHAKAFERDDFSHDRLDEGGLALLDATIAYLEAERQKFLADKEDRQPWHNMIQMLPSSYNQMRTVTLNYENLINIYYARRNHKLAEWHTLCDWITGLPCAKEWICIKD